MAIISVFAGNFAPRGWLFCQGQLLPIAEYDALFNLIGTTYGGDGINTFQLPDLRGRVAIHQGQGPGLSNYVLGQLSGTNSVTISPSQMPQHTHPFVSCTGAPAGNSTTTGGTTDTPTGKVPAVLSGDTLYASAGSGTTLGPTTVNTVTAVAGGGQPISIESPFLVMNYCICTEGIYPSQG